MSRFDLAATFDRDNWDPSPGNESELEGKWDPSIHGGSFPAAMNGSTPFTPAGVPTLGQTLTEAVEAVKDKVSDPFGILAKALALNSTRREELERAAGDYHEIFITATAAVFILAAVLSFLCSRPKVRECLFCTGPRQPQGQEPMNGGQLTPRHPDESTALRRADDSQTESVELEEPATRSPRPLGARRRTHRVTIRGEEVTPTSGAKGREDEAAEEQERQLARIRELNEDIEDLARQERELVEEIRAEKAARRNPSHRHSSDSYESH